MALTILLMNEIKTSVLPIWKYWFIHLYYARFTLLNAKTLILERLETVLYLSVLIFGGKIVKTLIDKGYRANKLIFGITITEK